MYLGPTPLADIFLAELSGDNIKIRAVEVGAGWEKAFEEEGLGASVLEGDAAKRQW